LLLLNTATAWKDVLMFITEVLLLISFEAHRSRSGTIALFCGKSRILPQRKHEMHTTKKERKNKKERKVKMNKKR